MTGSAQGTSIEAVQALSFVSLMTLIAMLGLLSFPGNKAGIVNVNIIINQLKIDKETISPRRYCEKKLQFFKERKSLDGVVPNESTNSTNSWKLVCFRHYIRNQIL